MKLGSATYTALCGINPLQSRSTSFASSSTINMRPILFMLSIVVLVVSEPRNRKSRRYQPRPQPRPSLRDDVLCAERWLDRCQCLQIHELGAGAETRRTVCSHTSYQNQLRCPERILSIHPRFHWLIRSRFRPVGACV